jgi:hypothetical protein
MNLCKVQHVKNIILNRKYQLLDKFSILTVECDCKNFIVLNKFHSLLQLNNCVAPLVVIGSGYEIWNRYCHEWCSCYFLKF